LESIGFIVEHDTGVAFLPVDNEDQVLLLRVADLISQLQKNVKEKSAKLSKQKMNEANPHGVPDHEEVKVDLDVRIFRENIASASLRKARHFRLFV
jgi:uncharacterized spore protein YtfJ